MDDKYNNQRGRNLMSKQDMIVCSNLLMRELPRIKRVIRTYIKQPCDVADVSQDVLIKIYRFISCYKGNAPIDTWVHRIILNTIYNYFRKKKQSLPEVTTTFEYQNIDITSPEHCLISSRMRRTFKGLLSKMPASYSQPYCLYTFENYSYDGISKQMKCPIGTVRSRIHRAKQLLYSGLVS